MLKPGIRKVHRDIGHDQQMTPIDFQVTRYIDHDLQMTPIDFEVTTSKVKVTPNNGPTQGGTVLTITGNNFGNILPKVTIGDSNECVVNSDNSRNSKIMKLHRYIDHDWQMIPMDFEVTRYIDNDWQMTPIDFQVTTSKVKVTVTRKINQGELGLMHVRKVSSQINLCSQPG
ncbi:hypothetical protein DPMN_043716 [Dreissena polymorpha]|uniref:IPT/TIG domain-containing protein n=1 Tax=Dreissena polymorpha TaxID=45954 RepID=A0A9D4HY71_DREPO|nr:hypothetical protein DPMN_043716 [Dreissena polymorpha]